MEGEEVTEINFKTFPKGVYLDFKAQCAKNDTNMKAALVVFMRDYVTPKEVNKKV